MITIGSDPEFGLTDQNGYQVQASRHLERSVEAEIGCDGHSHIGEIRPQHGETPREHLRNVATLITRVGEKIPAHIRITAGSMVADDGIGGHIHFGGYGRSGLDISKTLHALDYYLALPVALIEVQASAKMRRVRTGYGRLAGVNPTAHRKQRWGFEYRTLPSWLQGWGIALSVLSIGYAVVDAVKQKSCPDIPRNIPDPHSFNNCDKEALRPLLNKIRRGWRELPLYSEFRLEMAFLNHLLVRKMEWKEGQDIRSFWPTEERKPNPHVIGNPKDYNCPQIALLVKAAAGTKVFIYGLNPDRETAVAVNDRDIVDGLDIGHDIQVSTYGVASEYVGWLCIGLSYVLRQNVRAAADLVNRILRTDRMEQYRIGNTQLFRDRHGRFQNRTTMMRQLR